MAFVSMFNVYVYDINKYGFHGIYGNIALLEQYCLVEMFGNPAQHKIQTQCITINTSNQQL